MKTKHSRHHLSRTGQLLEAASKLSVPPKATLVGGPRAPRLWAVQNARLVAWGEVGIWSNVEDLRGRSKAPGAGSGFPFPTTAISVLVVLQTIYQLPLSQTEGLGQFRVRVLHLGVTVPDFPTI
jgi:hypothetical protein